MTKIVLVRPPYEFPLVFGKADIGINIPVGLMYLAAVLERDGGCSPEIVDAITCGSQGKEKYVDGDILHFGATYEKIRYEINRRHPDIVGINNPYTSQLYPALKTTKIVKEIDPSIKVVVGGPHASVKPMDFFDMTDAVDYVVPGEGDFTMLNLVRYIEGKIPVDGVGPLFYRKDGMVRVTSHYDTVSGAEGKHYSNIDEIPFPAYHLVDMERYFDLVRRGYMGRSYLKTARAVTIITGRGCPFNCSFCTIHLHTGRKFRGHSVKYVLEHIDLLVHKYRVKHLSIEDDIFNVNRKRFVAILDGLLERNYGLTWDTPNGIRADLIDRESLIKAKKSGLIFAMIGVESGDQWVLDNIVHKSLDLRKVVDAARLFHELDVNLGAFFIIGFPGETKEQIKRTLDFAKMLNRRYNVIPTLSIAAPYYGTDLYNEVKAKGYLVKEPTAHNIIMASYVTGEGLIKTPEFTPHELKEIYRDFYRTLTIMQLSKPRYYLKNFLKNPKIYWQLARRVVKNFSPRA